MYDSLVSGSVLVIYGWSQDCWLRVWLELV